jgi:hypothetical protein
MVMWFNILKLGQSVTIRYQLKVIRRLYRRWMPRLLARIPPNAISIGPWVQAARSDVRPPQAAHQLGEPHCLAWAVPFSPLSTAQV